MTGRIVKALADFYYVYSEGNTYQCKAKGLFRKIKTTPLVGDEVEFLLTNAQDIEGNVVSIKKRKSEIKRPPVANVDRILLTFAMRDPVPNFYLLDRYLVMMESLGIETIIVFNKTDLSDGEQEEYYRLYSEIGYKCICSCVNTNTGLDEIKDAIKGHVTSVAGPSGVGKSSIINALTGKAVSKTGEVSKKNKRGKQTTRHTELIPIDEDTFMVDTPGFSSTDLVGIEKEELSLYFPEFSPYQDLCRFSGCSHIPEPDCAVKRALEDGKIQKARYENYTQMYEELKNIKKY